MKLKETGKKLLVAFVILICLYSLLLIYSFMIPDNLLMENWTTSVLTIASEPKRWMVLSELEGTKLDTFTDNLIFQKMLNRGDMHPVKAAMWTEGYMRYWFGIIAFVRPLLLFIDYTAIRYLNIFLVFGLFFIVMVKLDRALGRKMSVGFVFSLLMINFWIFPLSLQYTPIYVVMMLSVLAILASENTSIYSSIFHFFVIGSVTNFSDLLTAPLLTFGITFIMYFIHKNKDKIRKAKSNYLEMIVLGVSWLLGYTATWISKWIIASVILKQNVIKFAVNQILLRTGGSQDEVLNIKQIISKLLSIMFPGNTSILLALVFIVWIVIFIRKHKPIKELISLSPLLLVALLPFVWFLVLQNHNQHHAYFTYRILMISVFGLYAFMILSLSINKSMDKPSMSKIVNQILKFGVVGVLATIVDFGILTLFTEIFGVYYLASAAFAFIIATVFNYLASMRFVFKSRFRRDEKRKELFIFLVLSLVGLGLNQVLMWFFVEKVGIYYILSKVLATVLVMGWNFISRKKWIE